MSKWNFYCSSRVREGRWSSWNWLLTIILFILSFRGKGYEWGEWEIKKTIIIYSFRTQYRDCAVRTWGVFILDTVYFIVIQWSIIFCFLESQWNIRDCAISAFFYKADVNLEIMECIEWCNFWTMQRLKNYFSILETQFYFYVVHNF